MKRILTLTLAIASLAAPALAAGAMATYANARFGYSISYPAALFTAERESDNGDGRVFRARSGGAEIRVWGAYNAANATPVQLADEAQGDCLRKPASYRVAKPGLVAISCDTAQGVLYEKQLIHRDTITAVMITYPAAERSRWDPVVTQVANSLHAPK